MTSSRFTRTSFCSDPDPAETSHRGLDPDPASPAASDLDLLLLLLLQNQDYEGQTVRPCCSGGFLKGPWCSATETPREGSSQ